MQIQFTLDDASLTVTLGDGPAALDLVAQLPLTLTMRDFHGIEKVADLPVRLDIAGEPPRTDANAGDLTYCAPWGNLAFFYRDLGYAAGLVSLGTVDGEAAVLEGIADGATVTVTLVA
ncbi:cyclophilin-like fold protein [Demequina maris]|uniref:cyclophilin-like fold protein n=1 Tax=Demequina maris TaxID=1638982 RepID=UPI000782573C|nr:cyclophilin-like fold protein [Demequina maris]